VSSLPRLATTLPWTGLLGIAIFWFLAVPTADHVARQGFTHSWLALLAIPAAYLLYRWPFLLGVALALGGTWLRLVHAQLPETSDQLTVGRAALAGVLAGQNPYGHGFVESWPPGAPFVYGPLELLVAALGVEGQILAAFGTMLLLAWQRTFITLAVYSAQYFVVQFTATGINDLVPGFLIMAGLLTLERHRVAGAVLLALAAGVKPYALAWFPPAIGYGGAVVAVALIALTGVIWSPLALWGPGSFLRSVELAAGTHPFPENTLNTPALRVLAVPLAIAAIFVRRWWLMVVSGTVIFSVVLFLDKWASYGYWLVILPLLGMLAERTVMPRLQAALRALPDRSPTTAAPAS